MAYYSKVALILTKEADQQLKKKMAELVGQDAQDVQELFDAKDCTEKEKTTGQVLYAWANIRWYYDEPDTRFFYTFMQSLNRGQYKFVRSGEEFDDNEELGELRDVFHFYATRVVEFVWYIKDGSKRSPKMKIVNAPLW